MAHGVPRDRPADRAGAQPEGVGHPARMRHARDRPARASAPHDPLLPRDRIGPALPRARGRPGPVDRDRRRWVPVGHGRPAGMDALLRRDVRGRAGGPAARVVHRDGGVRGPPRGSVDVQRAAARRGPPGRRDRVADRTREGDMLPVLRTGAVAMPCRTKLVCTLGPATATSAAIRALAEAGTDVFRVNLSHGEALQHAELVRLVRATSEELGHELAVMADLPGPKVRLGEVVPEPLHLEAGSRFVLRASAGAGDVEGATTTYPGLAGGAPRGGRRPPPAGAVAAPAVRAGGRHTAA